VLLLDKTGTITHGNRQASAFFPASSATIAQLAGCAVQASMADETPEGRSIIVLAQRGAQLPAVTGDATPVPFTAQTRMSGVDITQPDGSVRQLRNGRA
jgi:K+-transporting ATPase ATPase B chain